MAKKAACRKARPRLQEPWKESTGTQGKYEVGASTIGESRVKLRSLKGTLILKFVAVMSDKMNSRYVEELINVENAGSF